MWQFIFARVDSEISRGSCHYHNHEYARKHVARLHSITSASYVAIIIAERYRNASLTRRRCT